MLIVLCALLGLAVGSFLNVVIWRLPRGESLVHPPSACPRCGCNIRWYDNVPVLSWLLLRGRCRSCSTPISPRYPLVEIITAVVFGFAGWVVTPTVMGARDMLVLLPYLYLGAVGVALAFIDLDTKKLPNAIIFPAYVVFPILLLVATWGSGEPWWTFTRALLGGAFLYVFYFVLCLAGGMGFGDVKLAGVLGMGLAWVGWGTLIVGGFAAFLCGGLFSVVLLALRKIPLRGSGIPFGPWMIAGAFIGLLVGKDVAEWYVQAFFGS